MGIGLILVELTNIHNWRFRRSFARPIPGSGLADNAPACRAGALLAVGHKGSPVVPLAYSLDSSAGYAWLCVVSAAQRAPASPLPRLRSPRRGRAATATAVTRPRCHRRTVPGVTSRCARSLPGRSLISASTARRAQSHRAPARCGAAPRPRAAARAVPHPWTPANDRQDKSASKPHEDQIEQTQRHGRSSCPAATPHLSRQVTAIGRLLHPTGGAPTGPLTWDFLPLLPGPLERARKPRSWVYRGTGGPRELWGLFLNRRGPAARGGTPFVVCATAAESGRSGAGAPPVLRRWRHHLPGKSAGGRDHDQRPVRGADREGSRVVRLENAQDVGDLFAVTRAGPAPADHDPLADIGGCEADLEPVAHAGHLFPGRAARRRVPGPGPGARVVAGLGAAAGSGGRLRVGDGGMMPF